MILPPHPRSSACLLSVEKLESKNKFDQGREKNAETKENERDQIIIV